MPRHTSLTPEVARTILDAVRAGNFKTTAAAAAGVHRDSLYEWLRRGDEEPDSVFADFAEQLRAAEAEYELEAVAFLQTTRDPVALKARAWLLERLHPDRFGKRLRAELSGPEGAPIRHEHQVRVDPVALALRIDELAARAAPGAGPGDARAGAGGAAAGGAGGDPPRG